MYDPSVILNAVTSVLIVACPCALALSVPFTFGHALRLLGKHGLYVKNTETLERLAKVEQIVFDKTGTITQSQPIRLPFVGEPLTPGEQATLRSVVRNSTHPLSKIIYRSLPEQLPLRALTHFEEQAGRGLAAVVDGKEIRIGSASWVGAASESDPAATQVYVRLANRVRGYYHFTNQYRPGFASLMQELRTRYSTHLLSGDQDQERVNLTPHFQQLHFRQSPMQKLRYIEALEEQGHRTLMMGDGLNDAGALKQSYVGIAVADDIHHFSPACDAILDAKQLSRLHFFLRLIHDSMFIVRSAFVLSFLYNLIGLTFAVSGLLTPLIAAVLMPLSSVTVVGFIMLAVNWRGRVLLDRGVRS